MTAVRPPVPYVTAWTGENRPADPVVIRTARGIAYPHEHPHDRDTMGVLWSRRPLRPGIGRPRFGHVHPQRQRRAMLQLLCQVCGLPSYEDELGTLWLLEDHRADVPGWPEGAVTVHPPVCVRCAAKSPQWCPHLRGTGAVLVQVRYPDIDGVHGLRYRPGGPLAVPAGAVTLAYDDHAMPWVLAAHLTRELRGCTVVEPGQVGRLRS
ncbi:hypothetical protein [Streptomyces sp. MAR4 CNX-425]|uniref:hypothetical protein n=1 Tax=Streptomyces sp. MAR4 CNX-425 TaxID=3406343 RepID=UPI003B502364